MRVFKLSYSKPIPEGAKVFTRKGKRYARFDSKGVPAERPLTKKGGKVSCRTENWYIQFDDNQQVRRRLKAFTNKAASERLADSIQKLLNYKATSSPLDDGLRQFFEKTSSKVRDELIGWGLLDGTIECKTLAEYVSDFQDYLIKKERERRHTKATILTLEHLFKGCEFENWSDINADRLKAHLDELRDGGNGISKRTYNGKLKTAKHFCRWQARRLHTTSPIGFVEGLDNQQTDVRRERRAATPDEIRRLLEVTAAEPERYRMSGYERALLYRFAVETGFRAGEIQTLTVGCIDFGNLTVVVKAGYSKHRREDVQAIRPELAAMLKEHCRGKLPATVVFGGKLDRTAEMLKLDLAAAEIPYIENGRVFDFHALRHTFVTSLRSVSSRTAQALARHQSSDMTDRYTHIELHDERAALDALPDYGAPSKQSQKAAKTGTDDKPNFRSASFSALQHPTPSDTDGQKQADKADSTPQNSTCKDSKSADKKHKSLRNKEVTKSTGDKLADFLDSVPDLDGDLKKVIWAWPNLRPQARSVILQLLDIG